MLTGSATFYGTNVSFFNCKFLENGAGRENIFLNGAILGMTKVSREQGEWAGLTAARILGGAKPTDIPVVPNRQRDVWINTKILSASGLQLPQELMRKGKKIAELAR